MKKYLNIFYDYRARFPYDRAFGAKLYKSYKYDQIKSM